VAAAADQCDGVHDGGVMDMPVQSTTMALSSSAAVTMAADPHDQGADEQDVRAGHGADQRSIVRIWRW